MAVDEVVSPSDVLERRREIRQLGLLTGQLAGQIVVLDPWTEDPGTLREALAKIVHALHTVGEIAPGFVAAGLVHVNGGGWEAMNPLGLMGQLL